ncbi:MAG: ABC transporter ATP-binding protein [Alphaproteobacteria bacterium]|nr:ABC transporter ATP-binding protein [Alphaproteobacteria bacterium]
MSDVILATEGVGKQFGKFVALNNVSVAFARGKLSAIIGPNGAGKSTYFNILSGAYPPTSGRLLYQGQDVTGLPQHRFAHIGITKSFQITNIFPKLSAFENVRVAVQARHRRYDLWTPRAALAEVNDRARELLAMVGLERTDDRAAEDASHGEQRSLEIAMALAAEPNLLLLDEPTAGMSPEETQVMMRLIVKLSETRTVILVEHKMKLVMGICERIVVLHHGELLADGAPAAVRANAEVKRVYLGQEKG